MIRTAWMSWERRAAQTCFSYLLGWSSFECNSATSRVLSQADLAHISWRLRSKRQAICDLQPPTQSLCRIVSRVENVELHISGRDLGCRRVVLEHVLDHYRFHDVHTIFHCELFRIRFPLFPELSRQVPDHPNREIFSLPGILQDQWTRVLPVGLKTNGLVVNASFDRCWQHSDPHWAPCDGLDLLLELLLLTVMDTLSFDGKAQSSREQELHPGHRSGVSDGNSIELLLGLQIPDEKVPIISKRLKGRPPDREPVCTWYWALRNSKACSPPLPLDLRLPDQPIESVSFQSQRAGRDMFPVIEPERSIDQDQDPEEKDRRGLFVWIRWLVDQKVL